MIPDLNPKSAARWIGHGRPGELCLDGQKLNSETLNDQGLRARLRAKVQGFTSLELISCHVAAGPGRDFVRRLADMLGIQVYASSRAVGPAHLGGTYLLDFGYCPDSGCDLPGYEAAPVPGLNHLMPLVSVPFDNGIVGDQGTNPNKLLKLTNFSTLNIQISFFQQNSSTGQFVAGTQGNDIPGYLKIVLDDGTTYTIFGAINWQDKTGNTTETFGFLPSVDTDIPVLDADGTPVSISTYEVDGSGDTIYENWVIRGANHSSGRISNFGLERINNSLTYIDGQDNSGSADPVDVDDLNAYLTQTEAAAPDGYVTVNSQSTSDTTPVITGTFDIDRTNGETLSVIVDGQYYDENDPELTLTFDSGSDGTGTWTLDLNDDPGTTEEVEGQTLTVDSVYDVEATITDSNGYTLRDSTVDEVTVVGEASLTVNDISVNEGSPYAVFEVTSLADTLIVLAMQNGTATSGSGNDYAHSGEAIQTSVNGGASWQDYSAAVTSPTNGVILVRTSINNDTTPDNGETFTLTATIEGTSTSDVGTATIYDDGTGTIFNSDGSEDLATTKDDDRPVTVNDISVNEGSPYAVFNVSGAANQLVELSLPGDGTATGGGTDYGSGLEYWDVSNSTWQTYTSGTVALDGSGDLLVRTTITNDTVSDDGETFTLSASNTGGTAATGTATIKDDGTGTLYPDLDPVDSTTPAVDDTSEKDDDTPVITAPTINDITVNEGSDYAVFTVTGSENTQINDMVVCDGGDGDTNMTNGLADNPVEYWDGSGWVTFSNTSPITINSTGTLLLRVSIVEEQDSFVDNGEQFRLKLTPDGGSDIVGTATIDDDGLGVKYPGTVTDNTPDTDETDLDDDSDVVSINDVIVNEASDYAVNTVKGENNLVLSNLTVLSAGDTVIQNFDLKVYDYSSNQWTDFVADTTQLNEVGELLVRTTIIEEQDDERDSDEFFTLSVNPTGTVTIVDDGSGTIFTGVVDPETGEAETTTTGLDNDGYEIKALCGWETSTYWRGDTFVTQHYNTENGRTFTTWETDGYTSFELL